MIPSNTLTIADLLAQVRARLGSISESPGLEAHLLIADTLGIGRERLLAYPERAIEAEGVRRVWQRVERRLVGEPLPYVLGWWEFFGRRFRVAPSVLIPRPETELLVEQALAFLGSRPLALGIDVGTGSGCIAVTLVAECPGLRMVATDLSPSALQVAARNARDHAVSHRVHFVACDLAGPFVGRFDLVCANLPYIPRPRLAGLEVARREPALALDGGEDGLSLIRRLVTDLPRLLASGGKALLEIDETQGKAAASLALRAGVGHVEVRKDLAGKDRLLVITRGCLDEDKGPAS